MSVFTKKLSGTSPAAAVLLAAFAALVVFAVFAAGILSSCGGGGGGGGGGTVYDVTVAAGLTNGSLAVDKISAAEGAAVTITVTPASGYKLTNGSLKAKHGSPEQEIYPSYVSGSGATSLYRFTMPAADVEVEAVFVEIESDKFAITIDPAPNGAITSNPADQAASGATVTLTIAPEPGYKLKDGTLKVTNNETNNPVTPLNGSGNSRNFAMPAFDTNDTTPSGVTVSAEFVPVSWIGSSFSLTNEQLYDISFTNTVSSSFNAGVPKINGTGGRPITQAGAAGAGAITGGKFSVTLGAPASLGGSIPGATSVSPAGAQLLVIMEFTSDAAPGTPGQMSTAIVLKNGAGKEASLVYADRDARITGAGVDVTLGAGWNWIIVGTDNSVSSGVPDNGYQWGFYTSGTPPAETYWARTITGGETGVISVEAAAADGSGNVYIAGDQTGEFNYGTGNIGTAGVRKAFLVKYNASGTIQWARVYGSGGTSDKFSALALDALGDVYVAGTLGDKAYVAQCGHNDGGVVWSSSADVNGSHFSGIAVDTSGNVYVAGGQGGSSLVTYGTGISLNAGSIDRAILVKYTSAGAQWAVMSSGGTPEGAEFKAVAVDALGNIYAAGTQDKNGTYDYGNGITVAGGFNNGDNPVIVKYNTNGEAQWANSISSGVDCAFRALAVHADGIYAAGCQAGAGSFSYQGTSGPAVTATGTAVGKDNAVIVKYSAAGAALWAKTVSAGTYASNFLALAADASGIYAAGGQVGNGTYTYGPGVSVTGTYAGTENHATNAVLVKYDNNGQAQYAKSVTTGPGPSFFSAAAVCSSGVYAAGTQIGAVKYVYTDGQNATGTNVYGDGDDGFNPVVAAFPK
ncbi:MAG: hypothetical protein LBO80_09235 [Treponema sp.]|jgi:hypothetical protein|nr:hypothetical protein [Treponema sp.]